MRRFFKLLSERLTVTRPQSLAGTALEMTLHDAMRVCAVGHGCDANAGATSEVASRHIGICRYQSETDLHHQWRSLNGAQHSEANLTVVLALGNFLQGDLRKLIRRRSRARRLVIVPCCGHWPGADSIGDLALACSSLGWHSIEICRDLGGALKRTIMECGRGEQLILVLPAHPACDAASPLFDRLDRRHV